MTRNLDGIIKDLKFVTDSLKKIRRKVKKKTSIPTILQDIETIRERILCLRPASKWDDSEITASVSFLVSAYSRLKNAKTK